MHFICFIFAFAALSGLAAGQGVEWLRENYTKREVRIPMRDGVRLFTAIYAPKDTSHTYPILLMRTPYSIFPYGEDKIPVRLGPTPAMAHAGYVFVEQDVRGRFMSEGSFVEMRPQLEAHPDSRDVDESTDTYDTIDWLVKNVAGNNGRVGLTALVPGLLRRRGIARRAPRVEGRQSAGADGRPLPRRRRCAQRRLLLGG